jgi:SAM-dependent methyltransferase/uncharacterized protein YbaR (Trm112 family)
MKRRLLDIIRCPVDGSEFDLKVSKSRVEKLDKAACDRVFGESTDSALLEARYGEEILEGTLISRKSQNSYPVVEGVPRLVPAASVASTEVSKKVSAQSADPHSDERSPASFGLQWSNYQFEDHTWFKDLHLREHEFLHSMAVSKESLPGKVLLDAGCGHGALTAAIAGVYGIEAVGMDFTGAVGRAQANREKFAGDCAPFVHYLQGDLLQSPLASNVFDLVHCSGVIHHTPDPRGAFRSLFETTRPGGRLYVQVYRKREAWVGVPNTMIRGVTTRIPTRWLWTLCMAAVPVHTALVRVVAAARGERPMLADSTRRERAVSLFDNYSPRYQFRYHAHEIRRFLEDAGMDAIQDTTLENEKRHMVAFVGVKRGG